MRRLDDVERRAREPLDRRPFHPMPGEVQRAHGHAAIDDTGAGDGTGRKPIAPRRREEREGVAGRRRRGHGAGQAMHVFADARPLPKRGPIVEQNAHRGDSLDAIKKWYLEEFVGLGVADSCELP